MSVSERETSAAKPPNHQAAAYMEHDCLAWNTTHYVSSPNYHASVCGVCNKITGFRWRKIWPRIRSLFTSERPRR